MKTRIFLVQLILIFILVSCKKDRNDKSGDGITFRYFDMETKSTSTLVFYDEILGYDSTKYAFVLDEAALKRIEKKIAPVVPDPNFGIYVTLNNEIIYAATYIQPYSSFAQRDIITFEIQMPNIVLIELGYPAIPENEFTGKDLRNDPRLIEQLAEDNKLTEL